MGEWLGDLFEMIIESPLWVTVISLLIVSVIVSKISNKKAQQNNVSRGNGISISEELGDKDEMVKPKGWYRTQNVSQPVVKRTEEQQRIVDEYFIVRKYETTTCVSAYKKKYKRINPIANIIILIGLVVSCVSFIKVDFNFEDAWGSSWFVIGLFVILGGVICKSVAKSYKNKFDESIKSTTAPKKVMTDEEYEKLVDEKIETMDIAQLGLDRLGLDSDQVKEIHPIVIRDKVIDNDYSFTVYNENDYSVHSSTQHVTYLYFTDEQLFVYKIQFDMCCNVQDEWAHEFFYKDICDIQSYTYKNILKFDKFEHEYSSVAFSIISTNSKIGFEIDGDNENVGSIQAMKQKIREKKYQ